MAWIIVINCFGFQAKQPRIQRIPPPEVVGRPEEVTSRRLEGPVPRLKKTVIKKTHFQNRKQPFANIPLKTTMEPENG